MIGGSRRARWIAFGAAVALALLVSTLAMPLRVWRTGEVAVPPLSLVTGGAPSAPSARLWIDTDAACGAGRRVDPDDCFALLLLARTAPGRIVGVSAVGGNAPRPVVEATLRELMLKADADVPVHGEAAAAALSRALEQGPLTILALGPLTNVAAALRQRPDLVRNVERLIAVMGRRDGHLFHPSEGRGQGILFGHGPVFRDFNYAQDRQAAAEVLRSRVPVTMVPYEAARRLVVSATDLDSLAAAGAAAAWVASRSRLWLEYWRKDVGLDGFYPFDLVAAAFLLRPDMFRCAEVRWWIRPSPRPLAWLGVGDPLFVGLQEEQAWDARSAGGATYCPELRDGLHDWLLGAIRSGRAEARIPSAASSLPASAARTMEPPTKVAVPGLSPAPSHAQSGPNTTSRRPSSAISGA